MKEEIKKILKMVEEKKITAEEGEKLIDALDEDKPLLEEAQASFQETGKPKFLRVHIIDDENNDKVDVNVPLSLVEIGLKLGMQIGPQYVPEMKNVEGIDFREITEAIKNGARGKIVDVHSGSSVVEVYVD